MNSLTRPLFTVENLIEDLRSAVRRHTIERRVEAVKKALRSAVRLHPGFLPEAFLQPTSETYARRLVYADASGDFTLMAMVWGKGQGTPLHDHDGLWVVECVYQGRIRVTNYAYKGMQNDLHEFRIQNSELATAGEADSRIPPFEHHVIENDQEQPSVTLHVFGGAMTKCQIFEPVAGGFIRKDKALTLTR